MSRTKATPDRSPNELGSSSQHTLPPSATVRRTRRRGGHPATAMSTKWDFRPLTYVTAHWSFDPFIIVVAAIVVLHELGLRKPRRDDPDRNRHASAG